MCFNVEKYFFLHFFISFSVNSCKQNVLQYGIYGGVIVFVNYRVFSMLNIYCAYSDKVI